MSVYIRRLSDDQIQKIEIDPKTATVGELKSKIRKEFPPAFTRGCKLSFNDQLMDSNDRLKKYDITVDDIIEMDDSKDWETESNEYSDGD